MWFVRSTKLELGIEYLNGFEESEMGLKGFALH